MVLQHGPTHRAHARELRLEAWRKAKTAVSISRLSCVFAFESHAEAVGYASPGQVVLSVLPVVPDTPQFRADMLWLTWMNEPGATEAKLEVWCHNYWTGRAAAEIKPGATISWELLLPCALKVV